MSDNIINWPSTIYLTSCHLGAIYGFVYCLAWCKWQTLCLAFSLWPVTSFGITAGAHRLWAHRSYEANACVRFLLMLLSSMANQGSLFHWARDHRVHHKYVETDADPHNAKRGFFFAHMGWLLVKKHAAVQKAGRSIPCDDLLADPFVRFQKGADPWFALFMCFVFPSLVSVYGWQEQFWNAFFVAGMLRYVFVLHVTWSVNSFAHFYGERPYDAAAYAAENPWVSFFAVGEGWHNWHHKYPFDYAASEWGISRQYNPTKLVLDGFALCGWIWNCKRKVIKQK